MIWLYRAIFWPLFILFLPRYLWRLYRRGGNWRLRERFGFIRPPAKPTGIERIWIHAVSVGELSSLRPLLQELKKNPSIQVVLSTTTTTAYQLGQERYRDLVAYLFTFPIDSFIGRTWRRLQPDRLILLDSELWPETLHLAYKSKTPVYLINARLSDRSYRRLSWARPVAGWMMRRLSLILPVSTMDAERFLSLGANPELVSVTGNIKFDATMAQPLDDSQRTALLSTLGWSATDPIIVGSSTWEGEEAALIAAYRDIRPLVPGLRLMLVPRHAERRSEVLPLLASSGFTYHQRSAGPVSGCPDIVLADTTGELGALVQLAAVVVVGKSFRPHNQGQSPIEAAAAGKPVLMGYGMSNFRTIAGSLVKAQGGLMLGGPAQLKETLRHLLTHPQEATLMGQKAYAWYISNRGATKKIVEWLDLAAKPINVSA